MVNPSIQDKKVSDSETHSTFALDPKSDVVCLSVDHKAKAPTRKHTHRWYKTSEQTIFTIEDNMPHIFAAIQELPRELAFPSLWGLSLSRNFYVGNWRRRDYLKDWLPEHHVILSPVAMDLLRILSSAGHFLTWDVIVSRPEIRKHAAETWGNLKAEVPKRKEPDERDIAWLIESRKWSREQAMQHLKALVK